MINLNYLFDCYKNQQRCTKCNYYLLKIHNDFIGCQNKCFHINLTLNRFQIIYEGIIYLIDYHNNIIVSIIDDNANILCKYIPEDIIKDFAYPIIDFDKLKTIELFQ